MHKRRFPLKYMKFNDQVIETFPQSDWVEDLALTEDRYNALVHHDTY